MSRCIIITAYQSLPILDHFSFTDDDYIICADGGYTLAEKEGIIPHTVIGDFDSNITEIPSFCEIICLPAEKDYTDTMVCLKHGISRGYDEFYIIGGLGGRLDHTFANLQLLSYAIDNNTKAWIIDGKNKTTMTNPGIIIIPKIDNHKISLFTYTDCCEGVCISGVKYPLSNHLLTNDFPLGISNEFLEGHAQISHSNGKLLIVLSCD